MGNRRTFVRKATLGAIALNTIPIKALASTSLTTYTNSAIPKISLAQWSLHRALEKGEILAIDFASIAKNTYDIAAVEYVNQFYVDMANSSKFWSQMKDRADTEGVQSLLIMVDNEGNLGNTNDTEREIAVKNHFKWIHAAKILGCHSIRVNAFGTGSLDELESALVDGLGQLAQYGAKENINVLIENHGLHTSNAAFITNIIKKVDNTYLGTLPDFGNWCLGAEWGSTAENKSCAEKYPPYEGVSAFLPYAQGVSAKSYDFDSDGNQSRIDYPKLMQLVKDSGFNGHIGIEYEGDNLSEPEGIKATKTLIERVWTNLD